jgi:hypothetical protein
MFAPNGTLTINGVEIGERYGAVVASRTLKPPEPKTYTVSVPCGQDIDLTEALTGDVAFEDRSQTFKLLFVSDDSPAMLSKFVNRVQGRRLDYQLSDDPVYTYTGRFEVSANAVEHRGERPVCSATVKVTADPYKLKEHCAYRLNATGGRMYRFESGRRPVHPTIECESVCFVTWQGEEIVVPAGTYRLNDVVFREGFNELYVNSCKLCLETWGDLAQGGKDAATWDSLTGYRWDDLQRLGITEDAPQDWAELAETRWEDLGANSTTPKRWDELDYRHGSVADTTVYITYDWEDL